MCRNGLADGERLRVDERDPRRAVAQHEPRAAAVEAETRRPQLARAQRDEVDAARRPPARVEGMDERVVAAAVVERVRPAAVGARNPRQRESAHGLVRLVRVDDRPQDQPTVRDVVGPNRISGRIPRRDVLDQVHEPPVR